MKDFKELLHDGMTIAISGIDSSYYPRTLIKMIDESGVKDLTLVYIENNAELDPVGDPMDLVLHGKVKKLVTSHLGYMAKTFRDYVQEVELIPMDMVAFKMQAAANRLPGVVVDKDYALLYRDTKWLNGHSFMSEGKWFVFEPAFKIDLGVVLTDCIDLDTLNCKWNGTAYNAQDVARAGDACAVEYLAAFSGNPDDADLPGAYVDCAVQSVTEVNGKFSKHNWEE